MNRKEIGLLCILFLFAFALRFYDLSYPSFRWSDENAHVPAATNYLNNGQFEPDNWEHPPLRHFILYCFLQVFGDNPFGWRMRNVLFGSLSVVLLYLFASKVTNSKKTACMAALILASDPLHIVLSRYTFDEVYGTAFFLSALVLYLKHGRQSFGFVLSAFFMGCALATKWYYAPCWLMICLLALREDGNYRDLRTTLFITGTYILIPLSVFIISYYPWFGRGYTFAEFLEFITNAYYSLQNYKPEKYQQGLFFLSHTSAVEWFIRPVIVGQGTYLDNTRGEFILYANSLPIWILTIPSVVGLAIVAFKKKNMTLALPALFFCATYMLFLFIRRPAFIYSATPLLPFAFTAIAYGIAQLTNRYSVRLFYVALAIMLTWNLYLYPLVTAKKVPIAPYQYILNNADINLH